MSEIQFKVNIKAPSRHVTVERQTLIEIYNLLGEVREQGRSKHIVKIGMSKVYESKVRITDTDLCLQKVKNLLGL